MKKTVFLTMATLLCCHFLAAQNGIIRGKVTGIENKETPLIYLLRASDKQIIKVTPTEDNGDFVFEKLTEAEYILNIKDLLYEGFSSEIIALTASQNDIKVADIQLKVSAKEMQEIKVTATRPFVSRTIDRVIIDPEALPSNAGVSALEVLEKAPGLLVDVNGNISMKGKPGVMIFIDDKPSYLSSADLANYLRSLPSGSIQSVELMTNPPAKYDAAGNAGIINIRLKKNTVRGLNGGINLAYGQGKYARTNNSFNLNYRINKFNFFSNLGFNQNSSYQDLTINRYYFTNAGAYNSGFTQNSYIGINNGGRSLRLGMDYYMNSKSTLGVGVSGFYNPQLRTNDNNAKVLDSNNQPLSLIHSYTDSERKWKNGSVNANYTYKINNKGSEISANADYITYVSKHQQSLENNSLSPKGDPVESTLLNSSLPSDINIRSIKVDYTLPLQKIGKLDLGAKYSDVDTDNNALFFDEENGISKPNFEFTNRFLYQEKIGAGYLNYSNEWKKISVQLGLRLENTRADGNQLGNEQLKDSSFTFNYTNFFPTLFVLYKADSLQHHQFGFSIGKRINRPDYQSLNPFTYPIDKFTYYGGNPFLRPTYSYNLEVSHTFKNFLTTTLEYSIINDLIQETNEQRGTIYYSRPGNFGRQSVYGVTVNGNITIKPWWTLQLYSEAKNIDINTTIYGQPLVENRWYWYLGPVNQWKINDKLNAELGGSYQTRILSGQFLTISVWQMRMGASYKILKNNGTLRFSLTDMFYTNQPGGDIRNIANSKANWLSYLDTRVATISFSYRFNKGKSLQARQNSGVDTEKSRVKT